MEGVNPMARSKDELSRRGRRPSLKVAARKAGKIQSDLRALVADLEDLQRRLLRLETLLEASRRAEREKAKRRAKANAKGIRGKGPSVSDLAAQILARRRKPMSIQDISKQVLRAKKGGEPGENFTQNLGAALARDGRFYRAGRGTYALKG